MKKNKEAFDISELLSQELRAAANKPSFSNYQPHKKQVQFHSADTVGRLYIGGNRSGKTVGGCNEAAMWLLRKHPYYTLPDREIRGRIVGVDFPNGIQKIILPLVRQWFPPSALINGSWEDSWAASLRTLTLSNGSFCEFMSYDQELDSFAGTSRDFVWFDEEPPQNVFNENKMRLIDVNGRWWITMTPVEGMTWVYEVLYENRDKDPHLTVIEVGMEENPYLPDGAAEILLQGLDNQEKEARKHGRFVSLTGLIFRYFDGERHIISPIDPNDPKYKDWKIVASMDHGFNNPTAWLWHLVSPTNQIITFAEHYQAEWTVKKHVAKVRQIEAGYKIVPEIRVGDPAIKQRNAVSGDSIQAQYKIRGIPIALANNEVLAGIDKMNDYLEMGQWLITENCPNLAKELRRYRWKSFESAKIKERSNKREEPQKKDDHAIDSARYWFSFMPDLHIHDKNKENKLEIAERHSKMLNAKTGLIQVGQRFVMPPQTNWTPSDDTEYI